MTTNPLPTACRSARSGLAAAATFALAWFALASPQTHAAISIGWNYQGVGGVGLGAGDVAGAPGFEQDNWNNHAGAGQGPGAVPLENLADSSGAATTLDVTSWTLVTNNSWQHSQTANPNEVLMNDFNDTEPSLSFGEIPFATYNIVVYYGNNEGPSVSTLSVGGVNRDIKTGNTALGSYGTVGFVEGTDLSDLSPAGASTNYSVFTGFTSDSITVSLAGANNNGISAIQIVQVPEPTSLGLLCAGVVAVALRRRRR